jgi:hypothetical protein
LLPPKKYCDITGLPAKYTDPKTRLNYRGLEVWDVIRSLVSFRPVRGSAVMVSLQNKCAAVVGRRKMLPTPLAMLKVIIQCCQDVGFSTRAGQDCTVVNGSKTAADTPELSLFALLSIRLAFACVSPVLGNHQGPGYDQAYLAIRKANHTIV